MLERRMSPDGASGIRIPPPKLKLPPLPLFHDLLKQPSLLQPPNFNKIFFPKLKSPNITKEPLQPQLPPWLESMTPKLNDDEDVGGGAEVVVVPVVSVKRPAEFPRLTVQNPGLTLPLVKIDHPWSSAAFWVNLASQVVMFTLPLRVFMGVPWPST